MSNTTVIRNETQSCKDSRMHHFWIWILLNLILSYRNLKRKEDFQKLGSYSILKFIFWPPVFWLFSRPKLTRKLIYEGALQSSGSPLDDGQSDFENAEIDEKIEVGTFNTEIIFLHFGELHFPGLHMRSLPEEPHLAWVDVTFSDFRHLSWAYFLWKWAKILICWCQRSNLRFLLH